jgi:hypothetical protein
MLTLAIIDRVYLACGSTDLRKSIDGLAALVQAEFEFDPFSSSLFVFFGSTMGFGFSIDAWSVVPLGGPWNRKLLQ